MITVAITGGTGFIGRLLVASHLQRGDRVRVLTRTPGSQPVGTVPFVGDLGSSVPIAFADGADVVYHLAAEMSDAARMQGVNVQGTQRLLDAAMGRCGRWVQLSSVGMYGASAPGAAITELTNPAPANAYERSKLSSDRAVALACAAAGCDWAILRPSNVIGASMRNQSAFALVRSIIAGHFAFIGSRDAISTYIHVDDVVVALRLMASAPAGSIVNVSSDCPWTLLVQRVCERVNRRQPRARIPLPLARLLARTMGALPGFPLTPSRVESIARVAGYPDTHARNLLGYRPRRPMPEGFDDVTAAVLSCSTS